MWAKYTLEFRLILKLIIKNLLVCSLLTVIRRMRWLRNIAPFPRHLQFHGDQRRGEQLDCAWRPQRSRRDGESGIDGDYKVKRGEGLIEESFRMSVDPLISTENLFGERQRTVTSISPEQALIHLIKVETFIFNNYKCFSGDDGHRVEWLMNSIRSIYLFSMLSLPQAFRYSGLWVRFLFCSFKNFFSSWECFC